MLTELLVEYSTRLLGSDGHVYDVVACGRERSDGLWEGWLEYVCDEPRIVRRTEQATLQTTQEALRRWAMEMTPFRLDEALSRALSLAELHHVHLPPSQPPSALEEQRQRPPPAATDGDRPGEGQIDPFEVYALGEQTLRQRLGAMAAWQLRKIARTHAIIINPAAAEHCEKAELIERIVGAVRAGLAARSAAMRAQESGR